MLNCYIADDEPAAVSLLSHFVAESPGLNLVGSSNSALEAYDYIVKSRDRIDIAFLDVNMPKLSGIEMAKLVRNNTHVIITTAFTEYGREAFEADVYDYLLKPISYEKFLQSVNKVRKLIEAPAQIDGDAATYFFIQSENKGKLIKINIGHITYVEAALNYVIIYLDNMSKKTKQLTYLTMSEILKHLPENFIRIHKSFIVDIARISYLSGNTLYLEDNTILTVGSTYKKELHAVINRRLIKSSRS